MTKNGISWTEVVPWTPPAVDTPIRPITQAGPPEVAISLHGDDRAHHASQRRRRVDTMLEARGLRPRPL